MIREVEEEKELEVDDPRLLYIVSYIRLDEKGTVISHYVIIEYLVTLNGGKLKASGNADALKWVHFCELYKYDLTESVKRFFQKNRQKLANAS